MACQCLKLLSDSSCTRSWSVQSSNITCSGKVIVRCACTAASETCDPSLTSNLLIRDTDTASIPETRSPVSPLQTDSGIWVCEIGDINLSCRTRECSDPISNLTTKRTICVQATDHPPQNGPAYRLTEDTCTRKFRLGDGERNWYEDHTLEPSSYARGV